MDNYYHAPDGNIYSFNGDDTNCTVSVCPIELSIYGYRPSLGASISLIALYGICMIIQAFLGWRYRSWGYMTAMILGCIDEIIGYVGRIFMWQNPWKEAGFTMQIVLITIGPVFFSAAVYIMLSRIVNHISVESSRFSPVLFYWIFIPCDVISLILQAAGGAMSSSSSGDDDGETAKLGVKIALAGLAFQVATLVIFTILALDYCIRSRNVWKNIQLSGRFKVFVAALSLATLLIFIRCCYRVYELNEGYDMDSAALRDEPLFIGLESFMVIAAAFALIVAHPGIAFKSRAKFDATKEQGSG